MRLQKFFQRIGNVFMGGILRSPFHAMLRKTTLLLTFTGRSSGTPLQLITPPLVMIFSSSVERIELGGATFAEELLWCFGFKDVR